MSKANDVAPAKPSSTVVLARDADAAAEVYLVRRHRDATAFGGAYVFPGGVLDDGDGHVIDCCRGLSADDANRRLGVSDGGLAYYSAALRELFEETGVLLADHALHHDAIAAARDALNAASLDWVDWLHKEEVALRCDRLIYFSHWITPDSLPNRFTTRFFFARMPHDQEAAHDNAELVDARWLTAQRALVAGATGELLLHFPTVRTLQQLAAHPTCSDLERWASDCECTGVEAIHPVLPAAVAGATPSSGAGTDQ